MGVLSTLAQQFPDSPQASGLLKQLSQHPTWQELSDEAWKHFVLQLVVTTDAHQSLVHWTQLAQSDPLGERITSMLRVGAEWQPTALMVVSVLCAESQLFTDTLCRHPDLIAQCSDLDYLRKGCWQQIYSDELTRYQSALPKSVDQATALRLFKQRELLRIGLRDYLQLADMERLAGELSDLAQTIVEYAWRWAKQETVQRHGMPIGVDSGEPVDLSIIAMGKFGGRELNFSSDIDLIFVYGEDGQTAPALCDHATHQPITNETFFAKALVAFINLLTEGNSAGFLYRVDTRLRPEGRQGPLTASLSAYIQYYENWSQRWERQALVKARPVGGDTALGERFLQSVAPYIYRKYIDTVEVEETLRGIAQLRQRALEAIGSPEEQARHVKNGHGCIRSIEFIVQAVQVLYGGQYPELRVTATLEALQRMHQSGLLRQEEAQVLREGYLFLRRVEHRLQMQQETQSYLLPNQTDEADRLARSLGFETYADFQQVFKLHTDGISEIYQRAFGDRAQPQQQECLLQPQWDPGQTRNTLEGLGFSDPETAVGYLNELLTDKTAPHLNTKLRRLFRPVLPRLMGWAQSSGLPDVVLKNFTRILTRSQARIGHFELLDESPDLLRMLAAISASSDYLSDLLERSPCLLEIMLNEAARDVPVLVETLLEEYAEYLAAMSELDPLDILRRLHRVQEVRLGYQLILGAGGIDSVSAGLSELAEFDLRTVLYLLRQDLKQRRPELIAAPMVIVGLGKLGGKELGFGSDLDIVTFYEGDWENQEFAARLTQRIAQTLNAPSPYGTLFEVDNRLRPYGKDGAPAITVDSAREYYKKHAQLWERQTLLRARVITGDSDLAHAVETMLNEVVYTVPLSDEDVDKINDMRAKIEHEKSHQPIKCGVGGLVDVEFVVQMLQLRYGPDHADIRTPSTQAALNALQQSGYLTDDQFLALATGYRFLHDLENRLLLLGGNQPYALPESPEQRNRLLQRVFQYQRTSFSPKEFMQRYDDIRHDIRKVYNQVFQH